MNSKKAMMPMMMISMVLLEFFAEADVKAAADKEEHDDNSDKD